MPTASAFPELSQFVQGYLNQDMDLWADDVGEAIAVYAREAGTAERERLLGEIARFPVEGREALFESLYGFDFSPAAEGMSVDAFFERVRRELT